MTPMAEAWAGWPNKDLRTDSQTAGLEIHVPEADSDSIHVWVDSSPKLSILGILLESSNRCQQLSEKMIHPSFCAREVSAKT